MGKCKGKIILISSYGREDNTEMDLDEKRV
jgi:hypothetical protein